MSGASDERDTRTAGTVDVSVASSGRGAEGIRREGPIGAYGEAGGGLSAPGNGGGTGDSGFAPAGTGSRTRVRPAAFAALAGVLKGKGNGGGKASTEAAPSRGGLPRDALDELERRFGERFSADPVERYIYSRDMGEFPTLVGRLVGGVARAVVQAESEEELAWLCGFSSRHGIPLTPRAAATSGYGGAIPVNGGVVVDLTRMNHVLAIDEEEPSVLVEPGVVWWDLERRLRGRGFALRSYPSSAPSSTVGGWVAEGGSGIGAYRYGGIADSVRELRVVSHAGARAVNDPHELSLYVGSEGILGFISAVRVAVRRAVSDEPHLFSFPSPEAAQRFVASLAGTELPVYHLQLITPRLASLKNSVSDTPYLPEDSYLALAVLEKEEKKGKEGKEDGDGKDKNPPHGEELARLAASAGGVRVEEHAAEREWEERLYPMRIKKAGPSLVPAEARVPTSRAGALLAEVARRLPELALEVVVGGDGMSVFLGFIPCDSRAADFTTDYTASLEFLRLAEKHGGAPYGTGLYFVGKAGKSMGMARRRRLREAKGEVDPACLLNPGKLVDTCADSPRLRALRAMMAAAELTLPLAAPARGLVPHVRLMRRRLPEKVEEAAFTCAQCGYCKEGCTLYAGRGWESASPRGKMQYLRGYARGEVPLTEEMADTFLLCTTCKKCDLACQTDLPIESVWEEMRGELIAEGKFNTFPPFEMMGASYDLENNIWAGFAQDRDAWLPEDIKPAASGPVLYWAGCTASYVEQDIARGAARILKEGGIDFAYLGKDETCCGVPFLMSGKWDVFEKAVRKNIRNIRERGVKTIYTSCPGCWVTLAHHYREWAEKLGLEWDVEVKHITEVAAELVRDGKLNFKREIPMKVTWHDPCHIGRHGGIYEEPREVLEAIPGLELTEMEHNREDGLCCGSVLTLIGETRPTSGRIAHARLEEARASGAEAVVTTCPCCEFQLRVWNAAEGNGMKVLDFAAVVAEALGEELEDPDPRVQDSWAVFDVMIQLMTPQGMADFMWEFLDSISPLLVRAMRLGRKLPGPLKRAMFAAADRAMPPLMPRMLPVMMPWMLPRMMPLMEAKMPTMTESMRELMPDILPRVMERIMPYMMPRILRCMMG
ncbi:MAG: FAD-binding oxidoreductase [Actinobacteria bacterium]|nr:FAD-binding oxidoreductase [Actinomycetota bacterium]MDI6830226.1 FAD-binding and (Fe-S)-binding domain-containing protein [Actinomycetota bacterium]